MPIMTSQMFGVHKTHSAFPWGMKRAGGKPKSFPLFFYRENLHPPQPGCSCSQLHSAQRLQEQAGLLSPRAWFAFPGPFPIPWQPRGLILLSLPWSCTLTTQLWHRRRFFPSRVRKSAPQGLFPPPQHCQKDPTEPRGLWMGPHSLCTGTKEVCELPLYKP